ncbi:MAG TPA: 50S ribosomal protein L19 [Candidatus Moranbacteria bacterium]|nr:50S ribosomal protein L19 [Candidatus Moranbacteria bacterium]
MEFNQKLREGKKIDFQAGDVVKIHLKIKEGKKERIQIFEGLIIAVKGKQSSSPTITVRKVSHGVGVEMIIPVLSKNVSKIEWVKRAKVRRAKLYYVRKLTAKQSRMKYREIKDNSNKEKKAVKKEKEEKPEAEEKKIAKTKEEKKNLTSQKNKEEKKVAVDKKKEIEN